MRHITESRRRPSQPALQVGDEGGDPIANILTILSSCIAHASTWWSSPKRCSRGDQSPSERLTAARKATARKARRRPKRWPRPGRRGRALDAARELAGKHSHWQSAGQLHVFSPAPHSPSPQAMQTTVLGGGLEAGRSHPPGVGTSQLPACRPSQHFAQITLASYSSPGPRQAPKAPPYAKQNPLR